MQYYIDGYNLLFYLFGNNDSEFSAHRDWLIQALNAKASALGLEMTLVFDSHFCEGIGSRAHYHHLEIFYTPENVNADDYIVKKLQHAENPSKIILITNDKGLAFRAKGLLVSTQPLDQFINWLDRRYKNKKSKNDKPAAQFKLPALPPSIKELTIQQPTPKSHLEEVSGSFDYYLAQFTLADEKFLAEKVAAKLKRKQDKKKQNRGLA